MEKIYKLLHKKYDKPFAKNAIFKAKRELMEEKFKEFHLTYTQEDDFSFFRNEIIYQGILHKIIFEDAYFQAKNKMNDFYQTLDFEEKQRLMNYDIHEASKKLTYELIDTTRIHIPFFDIKMNVIYNNEIVLFDIKKYNNYVFEFKDIMIDINTYGTRFYNLHFCSGEVIYTENKKFSFYCDINKTLYFIDDFKLQNHLTLIHDLDKSQMQKVALAYFTEDIQSFIHVLVELELIKDKELKKVQRYIEKGK